jgi:endonuclease/exonuclease/phosphatase family metal-dependent hydrolase
MQSSPQIQGRGRHKIRLPQWEQAKMLWGRRAERACVVDPVTNEQGTPEGVDQERSLKLLSFNIQVGIKTKAYSQYVTKGWKYLLPHEKRLTNLRRISDVVADYDLVALQEVDGGSIRSNNINQVEYLAKNGGFPYWYAQTNRDLGRLAQHGNGLLSRIAPHALEDHKLPGAIPGRGAVIARMPYAGDELVVVMLHLSLGDRSRHRQLAYIAELIAHERQVVVMGDMNTSLSRLMADSPLKNVNLRPTENPQPTYPAWQPSQVLDHILVSSNLVVKDFEVLGHRLSDHLPVALELAAVSRPAIQ